MATHQLGQSRPTNTTAVSIYAPSTFYITEIKKIIICNTTAIEAVYSLFHDEDGTTYDETTAIAFSVPLIGNGLVELEFNFWMLGANGGNLAIKTGTNSALTFTVYGSEDKQ